MTKPCRKCGIIDRNPKKGYCQPCQRNAQRTNYLTLTEEQHNE